MSKKFTAYVESSAELLGADVSSPRAVGGASLLSVKPAKAPKKVLAKDSQQEDFSVMAESEGVDEEVVAEGAEFVEDVVLAQAPAADAGSSDREGAAPDGSTPSAPAVAVFPFAGLLGGGAALAVVAAASDAGPGAPSTPNTVLRGSIVLGPVLSDAGLTVAIFGQVNGVWQQVGSADVDQTGAFTVDLGSYIGSVVAKVVDANGDEVDFMNEDGVKTDIAANLNLMAVGYATSGEVTLNISYETTIAAKVAGVPSTGVLDGVTLDQAAIVQANATTAAALGLSGDVTQQNTVPVINVDGTPNIANATLSGKVAATLSALLQTSADPVVALQTLANAINRPLKNPPPTPVWAATI